MNSEKIINVIVSSAEKNTGALTGITRCEREFCVSFKQDPRIIIKSITDLEKPNIFGRYFLFFLSLININWRSPNKEIFHFASQQLAYPLAFRLMPYYTMITVFDLFQVCPDPDQEFSCFERIKHFVMKNKIKKADKIFTISEYVKKEIINKLGVPGRKIEVVYDGLDHAVFHRKPVDKKEMLKKCNIPVDKKIILFVGSEHHRKNFKKVLKVFSIVQKKQKNIILIKIGKPQWKMVRQENIRLVNELGIREKVFFTDFVPEEDLVVFYNIAELFLCLTLREGGVPLPVLEAMACGCPVILSDIPVLRERIGRAGMYVNLHDEKDICDKVMLLLRDRQVRDDMIKKGIAETNEFSWEKSSDKIYEVYKQIRGD